MNDKLDIDVIINDKWALVSVSFWAIYYTKTVYGDIISCFGKWRSWIFRESDRNGNIILLIII